MKARRLIVMIPAVIAGIAVFVAIGGFVVRELWNWLLPPLFGVPPVRFWQAIGLLALSRILFGGFGRSGGHHSRRWERMTPEDREQARQRMRARFGFGPPAGETKEGLGGQP